MDEEQASNSLIQAAYDCDLEGVAEFLAEDRRLLCTVGQRWETGAWYQRRRRKF